MITYHSLSLKETRKIAEEIIKKIISKPRKRAAVLALSGNLGSGKTVFVKAAIRKLGYAKKVISPTFIIMKRYRSAGGRFNNIFHIDGYRLTAGRDLKSLGFSDLLKNSNSIIFIEWAGQVKDILPRRATWIIFQHGKKPNERIIKVKK